MRKQGLEDEALVLLRRLVEATEADAQANGWGVAPWYYEQTAIIMRRRGDLQSEVQILERYAAQRAAAGSKPPKLSERLQKAKALLEARDSG